MTRSNKAEHQRIEIQVRENLRFQIIDQNDNHKLDADDKVVLPNGKAVSGSQFLAMARAAGAGNRYIERLQEVDMRQARYFQQSFRNVLRPRAAKVGSLLQRPPTIAAALGSERLMRAPTTIGDTRLVMMELPLGRRGFSPPMVSISYRYAFNKGDVGVLQLMRQHGYRIMQNPMRDDEFYAVPEPAYEAAVQQIHERTPARSRERQAQMRALQRMCL